MRKTTIILFSLLVTLAACKSTKNSTSTKKQEVVYTVGTVPMYLDEFSYVFNKNKNLIKDTINDAYIEDYLNRSINYKLKLKEAYDLKMDTIPSYINELEGYRQTLAKSYLTDKTVTEDLKKEAYNRMQNEVRASHILVMVDENAKPEDSLKAFNKITALRNKIVNEGADFAETAMISSEDPSAKENKGDLGYFSTLQMIYSFENQAYNTPVGEVSNVFRTRFGYHILKVFDKRETAGNVNVSHIFMATTPGNEETIKSKMDAIYKELQEGKEFPAMVSKYSEDQATKSKDGNLGFINNYSNYPAEFKNVVFGIKKDGEITTPFETKFGYHIVKRIAQKPLDSYDDLKYTLDYKIGKDSRSNKSKEAVIQRIKKESNFKEVKKAKESAFALFNEDYLKGTWKYNGTLKDAPLFTFDLASYSIGDFAGFMEKTQIKLENASLPILLEHGYQAFVNISTIEYEEANLNESNEDFRNIYREYRDAILVFNISGDKVWNKASQDTTGLKSYYESNKNKYKWEERIYSTVFNASTKAVMDETIALSKKGLSVDSILKVINKKEILNLVVKEGKYEKGENDMVDRVFEKSNYKSLKEEYVTFGEVEKDQFIVVLVKEWLAPTVKLLEESKGPVISDYQKALEENWIKDLRAKYPVIVNQPIYNSFKSKVLTTN